MSKIKFSKDFLSHMLSGIGKVFEDKNDSLKVTLFCDTLKVKIYSDSTKISFYNKELLIGSIDAGKLNPGDSFTLTDLKLYFDAGF